MAHSIIPTTTKKRELYCRLSAARTHLEIVLYLPFLLRQNKKLLRNSRTLFVAGQYFGASPVSDNVVMITTQDTHRILISPRLRLPDAGYQPIQVPSDGNTYTPLAFTTFPKESSSHSRLCSTIQLTTAYLVNITPLTAPTILDKCVEVGARCYYLMNQITYAQSRARRIAFFPAASKQETCDGL